MAAFYTIIIQLLKMCYLKNGVLEDLSCSEDSRGGGGAAPLCRHAVGWRQTERERRLIRPAPAGGGGGGGDGARGTVPRAANV